MTTRITPKKPRFYIDANLFARAYGNVSEYQDFTEDSGLNIINGVPAGDMFHNNGTRPWTTDSTPGWLDRNALTTIDFTETDTWSNEFYQSDYCFKYKYYYPVVTINYFAWLGHNFGASKAWVEPFVSYYTGGGHEEHPDMYDEQGNKVGGNVRTTLGDVIEDWDSPNHYYHNCYHNNDGRIKFWKFDQTATDDPDTDPDESSLSDDVGRDSGWAYARFNDNNKDDDTFGQVWNPEGIGVHNHAAMHQFNTTGLRFYEYNDPSPVYHNVPYCNAYSTGWTYVLDHTPDLNIEMEWEYDGIKTKKGLSGQNFTNISHKGPAEWQFVDRRKNDDQSVQDDYMIRSVWAWYEHNGRPAHNLGGFAGYGGRRIWKLSFSYVDMDKLISEPTFNEWSHPQLTYDGTEYALGDVMLKEGFGGTGLTNDFFTRVIQGTLGGSLPFLFQPDSTNNSDLFLCEFAKNGINFTQVAHNVYEFDLTIREVW